MVFRHPMGVTPDRLGEPGSSQPIYVHGTRNCFHRPGMDEV